MIKLTAALIAFYTLLVAGIGSGYFHYDFSYSVLAGGLIMLLNLAGLAFLWSLIFSKKSIALAVFVIIFKYVILGLILWSLSSVNWLNPMGLVIGLASLIFAVLAATFIKSVSERTKNKDL